MRKTPAARIEQGTILEADHLPGEPIPGSRGPLESPVSKRNRENSCLTIGDAKRTRPSTVIRFNALEKRASKIENI